MSLREIRAVALRCDGCDVEGPCAPRRPALRRLVEAARVWTVEELGGGHCHAWCEACRPGHLSPGWHELTLPRGAHGARG